MRLSAVRAGDLVEANVRGQLGYCLVRSVTRGELEVAPISRGFNYRILSARQVVGHWRRSGRRRA